MDRTAPPDARTVVEAFDRRVDAAVAASPPSKAWVRAAIRRQGAPRPPVRLRRLSTDIVLRHPGPLAALFEAFPDDLVHVAPYDLFVGWQPAGAEPRLDPVRLLTEDAAWTDEWGTRWRHVPGGTGASPVSAPIRSWDDLDPWLANGLPDPDAPGRFDGALPTVAALGPTHHLVGTTHAALWERYAQLRGAEAAFEDLAVRPPGLERLLDAILEVQLALVARWASLDGIDAIFLTDDWGSQAGLLIAPDTWRRLFAPRYRRIVDAAHARGLDVIFHSCGDISAIVADLVDCGIDVLDPLQSEVLDLAWLAREFGGHVAFAGGLPEQRLPRLSPAEVREEVRRLVDLLGAPFGDALILAPSNSLLPDVPMANLEALFEACHAT